MAYGQESLHAQGLGTHQALGLGWAKIHFRDLRRHELRFELIAHGGPAEAQPVSFMVRDSLRKDLPNKDESTREVCPMLALHELYRLGCPATPLY